MKRPIISMLILIFCMLILSVACNRQTTEPSTNEETNSTYITSVSPLLPVEANGIIFKLKQDGETTDDTLYDLTIKQSSRDATLVNNIAYDYITNGQILYYLTKQDMNGKIVSVINKMNISTKESDVLMSGENLHLFTCNGQYLYYGMPSDWGYWLFIYDTDSREAKNVLKDVGAVQCTKDCVLATNGLEEHLMNHQLYLFRPDGTDLKKLPSACASKIDGKRIIYAVFNDDWENMKYDVFQYELATAQETLLYEDLDHIPSAFFNEEITLEEEIENDMD